VDIVAIGGKIRGVGWGLFYQILQNKGFWMKLGAYFTDGSNGEDGQIMHKLCTNYAQIMQELCTKLWASGEQLFGLFVTERNKCL
jgi:hypothetical protein